jgi:8-oxo-dGTP diphosphatase
VVHRTHRKDWVLPKGKLLANEPFPVAALREVREETGCDAELADFAGVDAYRIAGGHKVVLYWHMRLRGAPAFTANEETDQLGWLSPEDALARLDYPGERDVLARAAAAIKGS